VVIRTTLAGLAEADIKPPATIVIGAVAALDLT
jgi:siroheme synthase